MSCMMSFTDSFKPCKHLACRLWLLLSRMLLLLHTSPLTSHSPCTAHLGPARLRHHAAMRQCSSTRPACAVTAAPAAPQQCRDIAAVLLQHGPATACTLFCSGYSPDTSRGEAARLDFWSRLDACLHFWRQAGQNWDFLGLP